MNDEIYDDMTIEKLIKAQFGVSIDIEKVYARSVPAGRSAQATVLLTTKNKLYTLVTGSTPLTLGDVRKIILRMNLRASSYCAPAGRPGYFDEVAYERFKQVYPSRHNITETDVRFYRLMAPYNPALVAISEVIDDTIKQFDPSADTGWRPSAKANYRLIKTA